MGQFVVMQMIEFNETTCGPCSKVGLTLGGDHFCELFRVQLRGEGKPERCSECKKAEKAAEKAHA